MDFDPRWSDDPRDRDDYGLRSEALAKEGRELSQGSRGGLSNPREREPLDARDVFTRDLELPRGPERERVWARDSDVRLRGSEVRTLATVGAFRVVPAGDLRDGQDRPLDPHRGDLRHLRDSGLVETIPTTGNDRALVVLTERGRDVLERNRWSSVHREELKWAAVERELDPCRDIDDERSRPQEPKGRQEFHVGIRSARHTRFAVHRPRELTHDAQVYRAYLKDADRLREEGAFIRRVILDHELKSEYQQFLQERNRGKSESDGRPDRTPEEIHRWAVEHELPDNDGHVQFPDARIEYEDREGHL
jgi:DNA-binding PadR family transcriptional regulator